MASATLSAGTPRRSAAVALAAALLGFLVITLDAVIVSAARPAIQPADASGKVVDWMEKVSDEQYHSPLDTTR